MIDQNDIISYASEQGFDVTGRMLRYWQSKGLIPPSEIEYPGFPDGGSRTSYPDGTEKQVAAICAHLKTRRSLEDMRWYLWRDGFQFSVRDILESMLAGLRNFIQEVSKEGSVLSNEITDYNGKNRLSSKLARTRRKKVGSKDFPILAYLLSLIFRKPVDADAPVGSGDKDVLKKDANIFTSAFRDFISPDDRDALRDPYAILEALREHLTPDNLEKCLSDASDDLLKSAYVELAEALQISQKIYSTIKILLDGSIPAKPIIKTLEEYPVKMQAVFLLAWLSLRRVPALYDNYTTFSKLFAAPELESA